MIHPNEVDFRRLTEDQLKVWEEYTASLGKKHVEALKIQRTRQDRLIQLAD